MVILTLLASSSAFVATPLPQYRTHVSLPAVHLALDDVGRDRFYNYPMPPADTSKQPISPEGVEAFRERMRLRETGAAISEWSHGADQADTYENAHDHVARPPTEEQRMAADALFQKVLSEEDLPEGFGDFGSDFGI